ncbi:hypothetical protein C7212DRAFT_357969 [Tuber magnatum]|uniref:Uncharacterized protein n=1 Tax=Tuber magnatum TaxID=42249 RepID=A0A317SN77_9PEZI|nr:hypothetical protein C7212DRAFT_357969 [Tuber magnatum]
MVGGETVIQRGDGTFFGISQPGTGSAAVLQGGSLKHLALMAKNSPDRITLVTSYRAKAVGLWDISFLTNVRPYTDLSVLYPQWSAYRLRVLSENTAAMTRRLATTSVPQAELEAFLRKQQEYLRTTTDQMVPAPTVSATIAQVGMGGYYKVLERYLSNAIFTNAPTVCPQCGNVGKVDKQHLAECMRMREWRPEASAWVVFEDNLKEMRAGSAMGVEKTTRPDLEEVAKAFRKDVQAGRRVSWGIADELARLGLIEYLLEYLGFFGIVVEK